PYGRNIEGIGAASEIYFGRTAAHLTRPESISLSVIPQSPTRRALYAGRENRSLNAAQDNWYDRAKVDMQLSARQFSARAETERSSLRHTLFSKFWPRKRDVMELSPHSI